MAEGKSNRGIAESCVITENAVEKHVTRIFNKLGLGQSTTEHRRVLAVLTYLRSSR
jgi:DNA-binding NarL/FixJ family response regulator